ncbi:hypothetical protein LRP52_23980 [Photobacterium sp. ZSDE20]|uniref:Uncharacterized protein n=1 Tax=Photobacterium pectinilyticum TaxID=2906793 RepID=A0ABT1N0W8_9GAMM|nr:hypothetical protein [Photobacterium sp. ZSDE20]MCQ1058383.1 hypothetical protein [Photobacterium sp. ZSDE20]MDD1825254.1 hypothetical protein [Photobacterium sp. ZSDE20]
MNFDTSTQKCIDAILAVYPKAVRATANNIQVGDVLVNHIKVPALLITNEILSSDVMSLESLIDSLTNSPFYIVARTHKCYVDPRMVK